MQRKLLSLESEIVHQILISELAFSICKSIPGIAGRGDDLLPYFFNLNYMKGVISLHSLVASTKPKEISLRNYLRRYSTENPTTNIDKLIECEKEARDLFKEAYPISLRNKIAAHIDEDYLHAEFTCSYIDHKPIDKYIEIVKKIKDTFFTFWNYSKEDDPHSKIKEQSASLIETLTK